MNAEQIKAAIRQHTEAMDAHLAALEAAQDDNELLNALDTAPTLPADVVAAIEALAA